MSFPREHVGIPFFVAFGEVRPPFLRNPYFSNVHLSILIFPGYQTPAGTVRKNIDNDCEVLLKDYKEIFISVLPKSGEGYVHIAEVFTGDRENWRKLREINGDKKLLKGKKYIIPYMLLTDAYRLMVMEKLFTHDHFSSGEWRHFVLGILAGTVLITC